MKDNMKTKQMALNVEEDTVELVTLVLPSFRGFVSFSE